jgi:hypothetical protein
MALLLPGHVAAAVPVARMEASHAAFLKTNCGKCHTGADTDSSLQLDDLPLEITTTERADRWQKVMNLLNSGEMPPEDEPQPERGAMAAQKGATAKLQTYHRDSEAFVNEQQKKIMKQPLAVVLASPPFLYLAEPGLSNGQNWSSVATEEEAAGSPCLGSRRL